MSKFLLLLLLNLLMLSVKISEAGRKPQDCRVSRWSRWKHYDENFYVRRRRIRRKPLRGGKECPFLIQAKAIKGECFFG